MSTPPTGLAPTSHQQQQQPAISNAQQPPPAAPNPRQPPPAAANVRQPPPPAAPNPRQPPPAASNTPVPPIPPLPPRKLTTSQTFLRRPPLNLPCEDLISVREDYINTCVPLYEASINGDWETANRIIAKRKELVRFSITVNGETALHIATSAQNTEFVEALVGLMEEDDLELQNKSGNTALCLAAAAGNVQMTKIMVNKNKGLLTIAGSQKMMPLYMAALFGHHDTVSYLYDNSHKMDGDFWTPQDRNWVVLRCIEADLFDIALKILVDLPELAKSGSLLGVLARKPYAFEVKKPHFLKKIFNSILTLVRVKRGPKEKETDAMKLLKLIWNNIMKLPTVDVDNLLRGPKDMIMKDGKSILQLDKNGNPMYSSRILFVAAEMGNTKFVVELIRLYPDLIWKQNDNSQSIFHVAVSHRHESIYNLLYEIGSMKDQITPLKDSEGNNMLHLVGKYAPKNRLQDVTGVAFQMQRELLWFKEVERMIPPSYRERKNTAGLTPRELFTKNHKDLVSKGEDWMKGTANQSMVVAALIATIVFGVAFAIPGGYDQNTGYPMFIKKEIFIAFVISDAISLIFSAASILMFLSILTSRYAEQDFLISLPQKLMMGLATLFLSIMTMMIAFSFSFFVLYKDHLIWVPILISVVAAIPVIMYAKLQYPLLVDVYGSIYGSRYIFKPKKRMLYNQQPKF
ncbi:unnamed protein product [Lactuca virosa]|uniref:PGG domain-containing protein n=1 Tax=Lactuca virosa TaxID=75947 RepID=A0AAU9NWP6_9ASTR|nr:unnamed protein product [Lactuca virosa]